MELLLILLILTLLAFPICAIWGFMIAWETRKETQALKLRLAFAEAKLGLAGPAYVSSITALPAQQFYP